MTTLNVCTHGHVPLPVTDEIAVTDNPRVNELLITLFGDRERCTECIRVRLSILLKRVRRDLELPSEYCDALFI